MKEKMYINIETINEESDNRIREKNDEQKRKV